MSLEYLNNLAKAAHEYGVYMEQKEEYSLRTYAILFKNGNVIKIQAMSYVWKNEDQIVTFWNTPEDIDEGEKVATFKTSEIFGVSLCVDEIDKFGTELKMLPCFDKEE